MTAVGVREMVVFGDDRPVRDSYEQGLRWSKG